jgi:hypothetical protein
MKDDHCHYCRSRGDLKVCLETKCSYHDLWMVGALKKEFEMKHREAIAVGKALLEYIDAIPEEMVATFPTMPGIDRDYVDSILEEWEIKYEE